VRYMPGVGMPGENDGAPCENCRSLITRSVVSVMQGARDLHGTPEF